MFSTLRFYVLAILCLILPPALRADPLIPHMRSVSDSVDLSMEPMVDPHEKGPVFDPDGIQMGPIFDPHGAQMGPIFDSAGAGYGQPLTTSSRIE